MRRLTILFALLVVVAAEPGLLRVPKVYNAVITSNQNLSPSRAYPVIQPVIHQTAIGYVPPFYYTQVAASQFINGPEPLRLQPKITEKISYANVESTAESAVYGAAYSGLKEETGKGNEKTRNVEVGEKEKLEERVHQQEERIEKEEKFEGDGMRKKKKQKTEEPAPTLSFYPNYQSLYYDPYFYTYNGLSPQVLPGTYYVSYQPYKPIVSVPNAPVEQTSQPLVGYQRAEPKNKIVKEETERIPDVPPPPLPTALPKNH